MAVVPPDAEWNHTGGSLYRGLFRTYQDLTAKYPTDVTGATATIWDYETMVGAYYIFLSDTWFLVGGTGMGSAFVRAVNGKTGPYVNFTPADLQTLSATEIHQAITEAFATYHADLLENGVMGDVLIRTEDGTGWRPPDTPVGEIASTGRPEIEIPGDGLVGDVLARDEEGVHWTEPVPPGSIVRPTGRSPREIPDGGEVGQVVSLGNDELEWTDKLPPASTIDPRLPWLPTNGEIGDVLEKTVTGNEWKNPTRPLATLETRTPPLPRDGVFGDVLTRDEEGVAWKEPIIDLGAEIASTGRNPIDIIPGQGNVGDVAILRSQNMANGVTVITWKTPQAQTITIPISAKADWRLTQSMIDQKQIDISSVTGIKNRVVPFLVFLETDLQIETLDYRIMSSGELIHRIEWSGRGMEELVRVGFTVTLYYNYLKTYPVTAFLPS
jgi:hypothetical protein